MKKKYLSLIIALFPLLFRAQSLIPNDIPSPNASDLGRFGNIPVSYYTGKADVSIPLYEFNQRGVFLSVSLQYDASGVLVNNLPGWTGHNWTLIAGGCITRVVQGLYDEYIYPPTANLTFSNRNYFQSPEALKTHLEYYTNNDYQRLKDSLFYNRNDFAPDIFYFNMMGISGRFFLGNDGEWKVLSDDNIEVIFDISNNDNYTVPFIRYYPRRNSSYYEQPKVIKGFILRDDKGTKYYFGGEQNCIEYTTNFLTMGDNETLDSWIANSWYLKKVEDRFGNVLYSFEYLRGKFIAQFSNVYQLLSDSFLGSVMGWFWGLNRSSGGYFATGNTFPFTSTVISSVYLSSISLADGRKLIFNSSDVAISPTEAYATLYSFMGGSLSNLQDFVNNWNERPFYYLQSDDPEITQYQYNPNSNAKYSDPLVTTCLRKLNSINIQPVNNTGGGVNYYFSYNFTNRMHLTKVRIFDNVMSYNGQYTLQGVYRMSYNHFELFPKDYLSRRIDHWGYLKPSPYGHPQNFNSVWQYENQRKPDTLYTKYGTLTSITYPTGGITDFCYEQNDFSKCLAQNRQSVYDSIGYAGGVRIKSITEYEDSTRTKKLKSRIFEYKNPSTGLSSGVLFSKPLYYWMNWETECLVNGSRTISLFRTTSIIPLSNSFGPHFGYSFVDEIADDNTKTRYAFNNISGALDLPWFKTFSITTPTPYDAYSERGYRRGKMLAVSHYDSSGGKIKETIYSYRSDNTESSFVWTTNLQYIGCMDGNSYLVGGIYKLFYPKYDVIQENTTTTTQNGNIAETRFITKKDTTLTITANGFTRQADIRITTGETTLRTNGGSVGMTYYYPFNFVDERSGLVNQFFLPPVKTIQEHNGFTVLTKETTYRNLSGKIVPDCELEKQYSSTMVDTMTIYCTYSNTGALTSYRQLAKPLTYLQWTGNDNYIQQTIVGSLLTQYTYDNSFRITSIIPPNGNTTYYEYDGMGRLSSIKDRNHKVIQSFEYNYRNKN